MPSGTRIRAHSLRSPSSTGFSALLAVAGALGGANLLFTLSLGRWPVVPGEFLFALALDMAALTAQLYFSGGATNPFIALYLLQVVLGAILLPLAMVAPSMWQNAWITAPSAIVTPGPNTT